MKRCAWLVCGLALLAGCDRGFPSDEQVAGDVRRMLMQGDSTLIRCAMVGDWTAHNDSIVGHGVRLYRRSGDSVHIDFMYRRMAGGGWKRWGFARVSHQ